MYKVLFCTNSFDNVTNGPAKFSRLIHIMDNLEITILTEDVEMSKGDTLIKVNLGFIKKIPLISQFFRMFIYDNEIKRLKKKKKYDVIIYNHAMLSLVSSFTQDIPVVGMLNDEKNLMAASNSSLISYLGVKRRIFNFFEKWAVSRVNNLIVNSKHLQKRVLNQYNQSINKVHILYKAVEVSSNIFSKKSLEINGKAKILFVKNDFEVGGLIELIEALKTVETPTELMVVGPDDRFESTINEVFNINKTDFMSLNFLGSRNQKQVHEMMTNADIYCVPSKHEAFGVANLEAMMIGIPIITTKVGGILETVENNNNGWLVEPQNVMELSKAINDAILSQELRKKKVENAKLQVNKFSVESLYKKLESIVNQTVNS